MSPVQAVNPLLMLDCLMESLYSLARDMQETISKVCNFQLWVGHRLAVCSAAHNKTAYFFPKVFVSPAKLAACSRG